MKYLIALAGTLAVLFTVSLADPAAAQAGKGKGKKKAEAKEQPKAGKDKGKAAAPAEDEEDDDGEIEVDLDDEGEGGGTQGAGSAGKEEGLTLGKPGAGKEEKKEGVMGGGQKLTPPAFIGPAAGEEEEEEGEEEGGEAAPPSKEAEEAKEGEKKPGGKGDKKDDGKKLPPPGEEKKWFESTTKFFELSGYFRLRADLFYRLDMGFPPDNPNGPFSVPYEARYNPGVQTSKNACSAEGVSRPSWCGKHLLSGANIRLRLEPTINLSELVKVKFQIDILDNLVLGSTPEGYSSMPGKDGGYDAPPGRDPWVPLVAFSTTQNPLSARNSLQNPITVRTAWGEVMLKNLGILKFGRMPSHWGLGLLANDGSCIDCNYGDIADRVLFATKLFGTVFGVGWDFAGSGPTSQKFYDIQGQPYDVSAADDVYQWLGVIAYKLEREEEERLLAAGKPVFAAGVYYLYRKQNLSAYEGDASPGEDSSNVLLVERDAWAHIGDVWFKFLMGDFRAELEFVIIGGKIGNLGFTSYTGEDYQVLQYGGVLQLEQKFLSDALAVKIEAGYASGDKNIEGLSPRNGLLAQEAGKGDDTISAMRFDPDYIVDMILFREIIGQVAASYYLKGSVSYWFIKEHFWGQVDIIYSRASEFMSTNGNDANLGVEFDISLKYKTKDHFTGILQYAYLIPLNGFKDLADDTMGFHGLEHPMTLQAMLAVDF